MSGFSNMMLGTVGGFRPFLSSYITAGSYTETIPFGAATAVIEVWGASGAGGGVTLAGQDGSGGGSGGYSRSSVSVIGHATQTLGITVGAGGAGSSGTGGSGSTTSAASGTFSITTLSGTGGTGGAVNSGPVGTGGSGSGGNAANTSGNSGTTVGTGGAGVVGVNGTGPQGGAGRSNVVGASMDAPAGKVIIRYT